MNHSNLMNIVKVSLLSRRIILISLILLSIIPLTNTTALLDNNSIHRLYFSIVLVILALQIFPISTKIPIIKINRKFALLSLAVPSIFLLSSVINKSLGLLLPDMFQIVSYISLSYIILIIFNIFDKNTIIMVIAISLSIVAGIISVIGILQNVGINILNIPGITPQGSTLMKRNFAVEFITVSYPWILIAFHTVSKKIFKTIFIIIFLITIFYLFILRGRAGYVALFISTVFGLYFYFKYFINREFNKTNVVKIFLMCIIIILVIIISSNNRFNSARPDLKHTISSIFDVQNPEHLVRINSWAASFEMFQTNPLFGVGIARWAGVFPIYNGQAYNDGNIYRTSYINPHNDYLEVLSENGIIAFICYLLFILILMIVLFQKSKLKLSFLFITISAINILIVSFFYFTKDRVAPMIIFYIIIGIAAFIMSKELKNNYQLKTKSLSIILLFFVSINAVFCINRVYYEKIYIKGIKHKMQGNYEKMLSRLEKINTYIYPLDPNTMSISYYKGVGYYVTGDYKTALEEFIHANYCCPELPLIKNNIGSAYYSLKDFNNAEITFLKLKDTYPNFLEPQINLLAVYTNIDKHAEAKQLISVLSNKTINETVPNKATFENIKHYYINY